MAAVVKHSGGVSLSSLEPPAGHRIVGQAGEAIVAGDLCYVASDGTIMRSRAAADNAAAIVRGMALRSVPSGGDLTLITGGERVNYGEGTLVPGKSYYLSATVFGGLVDTIGLAKDAPVGFAVDTSRLQLSSFRSDLISVLTA